MGERELILVLAALFFFSMITLSVNNFCLNNHTTAMKCEFSNYSISCAQSVIEEAKTKAFDLNVASGAMILSPSDFTSFSFIGPELNETYPNYNDVDDYNGLILSINSSEVIYNINVDVYYVDEFDLNTKVFYNTYYKKMDVIISNEYMGNNITLSHVFSYYDF